MKLALETEAHMMITGGFVDSERGVSVGFCGCGMSSADEEG